MKKEVKILYILLTLLWANVVIFIIYLSLSEKKKTMNKEITEKTKHSRKNYETDTMLCCIKCCVEADNMNY